MSGLFSSPPKPKDPEPPPVEPTLEDPAVKEAARKQEIIARKQKGRVATLLAGPAGVTQPAPTQQKTLLGE